MRKIPSLLLAALLAAPLGAAEKTERVEQVLTLPQSVQRALLNNQKLLSAREDIRIAEHRVWEARSQFLPQAGLNFSGSRYLAEQYFTMSPEFGSLLLPPSRQSEADSYYSARGWIKQPIYNGGRSRNTMLLAKADLERARIQFDEIHSQVTLDVVTAFYDLLLVRKQIALTKTVADRVDKLTRGVGPDSPARFAEKSALTARLRRALAEKEHRERDAYLRFLETLGIELYTSLDLTGEIETQTIPLDLPKLLAWAQQFRSEIRRTDFQKEINRLAVNLSMAERFPVVALGAGYEFTDPEFPLLNTQWNATLNVSLPLFDGFASRARIRQKRAQANQSRIERTELEDKINLEVRQAYGDVMYWQNEMAMRGVEEKSLSQAAGRLGDSSDGLSRARLALDLLDAQEASWTAVHGHRVALAKLEKAVGRPLRDGP